MLQVGEKLHIFFYKLLYHYILGTTVIARATKTTTTAAADFTGTKEATATTAGAKATAIAPGTEAATANIATAKELAAFAAAGDGRLRKSHVGGPVATDAFASDVGSAAGNCRRGTATESEKSATSGGTFW